MIERYLINYDGRGEQLHPSGDFVHYSDYADLERQLADRERRMADLADRWTEASELAKDHKTERDRLAADNARKDAAMQEAWREADAIWELTTDNRVIDRLNRLRATLAGKE